MIFVSAPCEIGFVQQKQVTRSRLVSELYLGSRRVYYIVLFTIGTQGPTSMSVFYNNNIM